MKTEHTQGPWQVHYSHANKNLASVTDRNREPIAPCVGENAEANARLIAAAPELLEALRATRSNLYAALVAMTETEKTAPKAWAAMESAYLAISKAEGNA